MVWERQSWLEQYQSGERISDLAEQHGVSRKTLYKWMQRYERWGEPGLEELSRAPHSHPQAVDPVWRERVRGARMEHRRWGAVKIQQVLQQRHGATPSIATIGRLLGECGLTRPRRRRGHAQPSGELSSPDGPNQLWTIDFKGWRRTRDGCRAEALTVCDQATRYLLCCQCMESTRSELVRPVMTRVFMEYGLPEGIRSDNGAPFASTGGCGLTDLSVWWIELRLVCERIQPGHPQQNGRHERMHRTLQEEAMDRPAATLRAQQRRLDEFRHQYNHLRPHQALGQRTPASLYVPSPRVYPDRIREPEYGPDWQVRSVHSGEVRWSGRVFVSHALEGKQIGFEPFETGLWRVWFYRQWLGVWDERSRRWHRPREWQRENRSEPTCRMGRPSSPEPPVA
jgi:transposase InsO family protein